MCPDWLWLAESAWVAARLGTLAMLAVLALAALVEVILRGPDE